MKSSKLSTILSATVLSAGLAIAPSMLPASAQTTPGTQTSPDSDTQEVYETREGTRSVEEDNGDWGLLGLLGLLGLAGLAGRNRHESPTYYADPARDREEVAGRSSTTYR
ncbi:MAG TPA: WGxxGxxG family protein [Vampirovibrionales bacterium]